MRLGLNLNIDPSGFTEYFPTGGVSGAAGFGSLINNVIVAVMSVGGLLLLAYFMYGALIWLTAGGDSKKVEYARSTMMNAVIGIVILVAAYFIVGILGGVLGLTSPLRPVIPGP